MSCHAVATRIAYVSPRLTSANSAMLSGPGGRERQRPSTIVAMIGNSRMMQISGARAISVGMIMQSESGVHEVDDQRRLFEHQHRDSSEDAEHRGHADDGAFSEFRVLHN